MDKLDKQILVVRIGLNQVIRGLKKDRNSHWRNKNYNLLKRKLEDLEFEKGVKEFEDKLIGGTK